MLAGPKPIAAVAILFTWQQIPGPHRSASSSHTRSTRLNSYPPTGEAIFDRQALKDALPEVSEVRLTKTLYAEYPGLKPKLEGLEGQKTHQNDASLAVLWGVDEAEARQIANRLVEVGFFERRGDRQHPTYWVPFMYRPALKLIQGSADGVAPVGDEVETG
jgi:hypothetical protein